MCVQRGQDTGSGREDVLGVEANPGGELAIGGEEARGGGVCDEAW